MKPIQIFTLEDERLLLHYDPCPLDPSEEFDNYSEVEVDAWRNGEVYGFEIEEKCACCGSWVNLDGCWGFYTWDHFKEALWDHIDDKWKKFQSEVT